jgi:hypothetical protein
VDGLACRLHRPMDYGRQAWEQSPLTGVVLSCHIVVDGDAFPGGAKPPEQDI